MAFEDTDRRRSLLLGVLTLIALPAIYLYSQSNTSTGPDGAAEVAADTAPGTDAAPPVTDRGANRPPITLSDADPIFLDGPVGDVNPGVNEIAIPSATCHTTARTVGELPQHGRRRPLLPRAWPHVGALGVDQEPRQRSLDHVRHLDRAVHAGCRRRAPHRHLRPPRRPDRGTDHDRVDAVTAPPNGAAG